MKLKKFPLYLICFLSPLFFFGQIKVSEHIQPSKIATQSDNALYFVDFWATWCGPCVHASKYLESLQKQYPDNFYVLSLTQESPEVVKRFMEKRKIDLAIAIDYEGETFTKNKVVSLPYGILYNAYGVKLWEGHPAEFKTYHLNRFLRENKEQISIDSMFKTEAYKKAEVIKEEIPDKDFEVLEIEEDLGELEVIEHEGFLELIGNLQDILAYSNSVSKKQIRLSPSLNKNYKVRFNFDTKAYGKKTKLILRALKLKQINKEVNGEAILFNITNPTFWDTNQINWGVDTPHFLIGDSEIKANNVSLNQISYKLANLLEVPIVISDNEIADNIHDWEIHYKYFDLMTSSMNDNYGIQIEKKTVKFPQYTIIEK